MGHRSTADALPRNEKMVAFLTEQFSSALTRYDKKPSHKSARSAIITARSLGNFGGIDESAEAYLTLATHTLRKNPSDTNMVLKDVIELALDYQADQLGVIAQLCIVPLAFEAQHPSDLARSFGTQARELLASHLEAEHLVHSNNFTGIAQICGAWTQFVPLSLKMEQIMTATIERAEIQDPASVAPLKMAMRLQTPLATAHPALEADLSEPLPFFDPQIEAQLEHLNNSLIFYAETGARDDLVTSLDLIKELHAANRTQDSTGAITHLLETANTKSPDFTLILNTMIDLMQTEMEHAPLRLQNIAALSTTLLDILQDDNKLSPDISTAATTIFPLAHEAFALGWRFHRAEAWTLDTEDYKALTALGFFWNDASHRETLTLLGCMETQMKINPIPLSVLPDLLDVTLDIAKPFDSAHTTFTQLAHSKAEAALALPNPHLPTVAHLFELVSQHAPKGSRQRLEAQIAKSWVTQGAHGNRPTL